MFIRYHLFYYALGCLIVTVAKLCHPLFWCVYLLYSLFLYRRLSVRHVFIMIVISFLICLPHSHSPLPSVIEGKVVKVNEHSCIVKTKQGKVKVLSDQFSYHDEIKCDVIPEEMTSQRNDHGFSEEKYLKSMNVFYKARVTKVRKQLSHPSLYTWIEKQLSKDPRIEAYQRLLILGEKSEDIQEDYQQLLDLSLVHLFALSGMHVHILYSFLLSVFSLLFSKRIGKGLTYLCLSVYIFSLPVSFSLYRAYFCLLLYDVGKAYFHELDILSFLVIVLLINNPYVIFNTAFQFSYFLYFIVLLTKSLPHAWFFIYIASLPLLMCYQGRIPLSALLVGMFFTPFMEIMYVSGFLSFISPVGTGLLLICIRLLDRLLYVCQKIYLYLPMSYPTFSFVCFFYVIFFMILYKLELRKTVHTLWCMMLALLLSYSFYSQYKIYGEVTMIDVGQGDCTLLTLPMNQGHLLIDTGGQRYYDVAQKVIIPYLRTRGIHHLDSVYISHDDFDHCGALPSLQDHFQVNQVIDTYQSPLSIGSTRIEMLSPTKVYENKNDQSLVMLVTCFGHRFLFCGDISQTVEKDMYERYQHLDIDVVKVPHHGSKTSSSPYLFALMEAKVAMIGVGKKNRYHHPNDQVIDRLKRKHMVILRTDEDGMFHIRFYGKLRYILK